MDDRTKLEKVRAIAMDARGNPRMREVAQRILARMSHEAELALELNFEEAYRRYAAKYAHTIYIKVSPNIRLPKRIEPHSVCSHRQLKVIFKRHVDWPHILEAMRRCVGTIGDEVP